LKIDLGLIQILHYVFIMRGLSNQLEFVIQIKQLRHYVSIKWSWNYKLSTTNCYILYRNSIKTRL